MSKISRGFTLLELLIAVAVIGLISVVGVNLLYSTVLSRSKQDSIKTSSEDIRNFLDLYSKSIKESSSAPNIVSTTEIRIIGPICRTFRLNGTIIEVAEDTSPSCIPPTSGFSAMTNPSTSVSSLNFTVIGSAYSVNITGINKDSLGEHPFSYNTQVVPRK